MSGSRERILGRVRAALADVPGDERPEDVDVPRDYAPAHSHDPIATLVDRLADYKAGVHRVTPDALADTIATIARQRPLAHLVVPPDLPAQWTSVVSASATIKRDDGLSIDQLDAVDGVITGCAVAVAETGTIVLDTGSTQGRRAVSLIPDVHLCVVRADQVVTGVPEAVARLDPHRPLTWISGPSATSDIELDRVEGVHGPRTLEVLIQEG